MLDYELQKMMQEVLNEWTDLVECGNVEEKYLRFSCDS